MNKKMKKPKGYMNGGQVMPGYANGGYVKPRGGMKPSAPNAPCGTQGPGVRSPQDYRK